MYKKIYLAGPITGLNYKGASDWRDVVEALLADFGSKRMGDSSALLGYSPLRSKQYLDSFPEIRDAYTEFPLSTQRGITARDRNDVMTCDLMLVNLLGAQRVSIGTMIEFGWADAFRKPIILVMEQKDNLHDHAMVREVSPFRVETLEEAVELAGTILLP